MTTQAMPAVVHGIRKQAGHELYTDHCGPPPVTVNSEERKHNAATNALCKEVDGRNGFELYRFLSREIDLRADCSDMASLDKLVSMGKTQCRVARIHIQQITVFH